MPKGRGIHGRKLMIESELTCALISTGRIGPKDRIEIIEKTESGDYARIGIIAFHGRQKKPFVYWNICVDMARELIHWDASTFYYVNR